jgi:hypothetical protein
VRPMSAFPPSQPSKKAADAVVSGPDARHVSAKCSINIGVGEPNKWKLLSGRIAAVRRQQVA